ncbi:MAG: hypothetical protein AAGE84_24765 [Cyanobacteria bacterium P01_G01_bin.39]
MPTNIKKAKIILVIFLLLFWSIATPLVASEPSAENIENPVAETTTQAQPIKTYFLRVSPALGRQSVNIDPPATNIAITSQSGDTTVRCGDAANTYSCSPGKRLELVYESAEPLTKFWGENTTEVPVRLQIDVYQAVESVMEDTTIKTPNLPTP